MSFRISARTILHLGSELISSDGIAFYELIKNALDARSPQVRVSVLYRLDHAVYARILRKLGEDRGVPDWTPGPPRGVWSRYRQAALDGLVPDAPDVLDVESQLRGATTRDEFLTALREANRIDIDDNGEGMSRQILRDVYLSIGTAHRAEQKRDQRRRPARPPRPDDRPDVILGEKGLGRLSAMRLGDKLEVLTGRAGGRTWNELEIDWNDFADAADADLSSVVVTPRRGGGKDLDSSGTLIRISALRAPWSEDKLKNLALDHFSRLVNPLDPQTPMPLELSFNGEPVEIPAFADFLLEHAHGRLEATFHVEGPGAPRIEGRMEYLLHGRSDDLALSTLDLENLTDFEPETLLAVGPFDLKLHWFNRRVLTKIEGIGNLTVVRRILADWAGGVALYRDGYRVNPYGSLGDDWLDLDRDAFSTSGFKLNRGQVIASARITDRDNPHLVDQTNREGLRDSPQKRAFVAMLASTVETFRLYLVGIDSDLRRARRVTPADALMRFRAEVERLEELLPDLETALAQANQGVPLARRISQILDQLRTSAGEVDSAAASAEEERGRVMHLASIGLMIEILAHELYRATNAGLRTIAQARRSRDAAATGTSLRVLDAQLRTLQKRLKVLDPLSTNARQTKEDFELAAWIEDIVGGFAERNRASRIAVRAVVRPSGGRLQVRAVRGMFVQVIENLLTNSLYWVDQRHKQQVRAGLADPEADEMGHITVELDTRRGRITVTDDGPGIPDARRETVFQPFFTTRTQKQGRGLGLYIAREIAEYHGGRLYLGDADRHGQIRSVIFDLGDDL